VSGAEIAGKTGGEEKTESGIDRDGIREEGYSSP